MEIKINKTETVGELPIIIENSVKVKFNMVLDIDNIIEEEVLKDEPDGGYPIQFCMSHGNMDVSLAIRVYVGTNTLNQPKRMDVSEANYEKLHKMKFRIFYNIN